MFCVANYFARSAHKRNERKEMQYMNKVECVKMRFPYRGNTMTVWLDKRYLPKHVDPRKYETVEGVEFEKDNVNLGYYIREGRQIYKPTGTSLD